MKVVFQIKINTFFSIIASKFIIKVSKKVFKGGTNFPGRVALKLDRDILKTISSGYKIIVITGTNGKTTTTSMIYNIIKNNNNHVITNSTGANLLPGIVSCFCENYCFRKAEDEKFAVIEIDEANLKLATKYFTPYIICITNLFRDQLDRYGEVYTTLKKILEGIVLVPSSKLILNGDESLLGKLDVKNEKIYYGFNYPVNKLTHALTNADSKFCIECKHPYKYEFITYNHLGKYYCDNCGYKRPDLKYSVDDIIDKNPDFSEVTINNTNCHISQPGIYNIYNGLSAIAIAHELNINDDVIIKTLSSMESSFGRQEKIKIGDKNVKIILVKNPAGFDEAINTVVFEKEKISLSFILNDNYADGRDVSWIWDVDFEKLSTLDVGSVLVAGIRKYDMAIRIKTAQLQYDNLKICNDYDNLCDEIKNLKEDKLYIFATYTAMLSFRKYLNKKGFIKKLW